MGRRSGASSRARRVGAVLVIAALGIGATGCGGGGDDDAAPPPPPPSQADSTMTTAPGTTTAPADGAQPADPSDPGITAPSTSLPPGSVEVPLDAALVDALPRINAGEREVIGDQTFDERLCTGDKAPAIPKGQARATYEISSTERLSIAGYRFAGEDGPIYLADYAAAVQTCAAAVGEVAGLGLPDVFGQAFELTTTRGDAFIAMGLRGDVIWLLFQESTDGPVGVSEATYAAFLRLLGG